MKNVLIFLSFVLPSVIAHSQELKFLYITAPDEEVVKFFRPDDPGTVFNFLAGDLQNSFAMAADVHNNRVFVSDTTGKIILYDLVGTDPDTLLDNSSAVLAQPFGLAFFNGKLHWAREGGIGRCNADGSGAELWFEVPLALPPEKPLCLAYNPDNDRIYFTYDIGGVPGGFWSVDANGTGLQEVVPGVDGGAVAVDTSANKIYYSDRLKGICRIDYDGGNEEVIDASYAGDYVWGMAFDPEVQKLYWTDNSNNKVMVSNPDGTGKTELLTGVDAFAMMLLDLSPSAVNDFHEVRIEVFPNPVRDVLRFEAPEEMEKAIVSNATGQVVMILDRNELSSGTLDVSNLPEGLYFLTGYCPCGSLFTSKFIRE